MARAGEKKPGDEPGFLQACARPSERQVHVFQVFACFHQNQWTFVQHNRRRTLARDADRLGFSSNSRLYSGHFARIRVDPDQARALCHLLQAVDLQDVMGCDRQCCRCCSWLFGNHRWGLDCGGCRSFGRRRRHTRLNFGGHRGGHQGGHQGGHIGRLAHSRFGAFFRRLRSALLSALKVGTCCRTVFTLRFCRSWSRVSAHIGGVAFAGSVCTAVAATLTAITAVAVARAPLAAFTCVLSL